MKKQKQTVGRKLCFQEIDAWYKKKRKLLKRKKFRLKARIVITVLLPILAVLIAVKVIETFVRIRARELFAKPLEEKGEGRECEAASRTRQRKAEPMPVKKACIRKETISPEPIRTHNCGE